LNARRCGATSDGTENPRVAPMTNEERDIITQFIHRVSGAQSTGQTTFGGSVPATTPPPLPPVDPEADRLIAEQFNRYPEARYRLTQLAFVQEHALTEAQNRMQRLEWELQQARQQAQQQQQQSGNSGGGFFSGLFGGGSRSAPPPQGGPGPAWNQGPCGPAPNYQQAPPPPPQGAPGYQPGMFQRSGSGFLGSALTTAAGVAGGLIAGNALMNLFSGSHGMGGGFGGGFGGTPMVGSPWSTPAATEQGYVDQGTWDNTGGVGGGQTDPGYVDSGTWDNTGTDQSSWTDNSSDSGFDTGGGGGSDDSLI
jgi:uncharacterized protein